MFRVIVVPLRHNFWADCIQTNVFECAEENYSYYLDIFSLDINLFNSNIAVGAIYHVAIEGLSKG